MYFYTDDVIQHLILDAPWFQSTRRLCAYISCRALREVDTSKVLASILQSSDKGLTLSKWPLGNDMKFYLPYLFVEHKESSLIIFVLL